MIHNIGLEFLIRLTKEGKDNSFNRKAQDLCKPWMPSSHIINCYLATSDFEVLCTNGTP